MDIVPASVRINILAQAVPWNMYLIPYRCQTTIWRCEHIKLGVQSSRPGGHTNGLGSCLSNGTQLVYRGAVMLTPCPPTAQNVHPW